MNVFKKRPSVAFVVAMLALFVALGGTAGAVVTAAVPLAKRALVADNAKKVNGLTAKQIAAAGAAASSQVPGPASSAAGLVSVKSAGASIGANNASSFTATCDSGQKATGGGYSSGSGLVAMLASAPTADGSGWTVLVGDLTGSGSSGSVYAVCLK
jgi:hypothetical protein